jgi:hypothetical protein
MSAPKPNATDAELRWAYRLTGWERQGISLERALEAPDLRAGLEARAAVHRRKRARLAARNVGAGIERSTPDHAHDHPDHA